MSGKEPIEPFADEVEFAELLEASKLRDLGIALFEQEMYSVQDLLFQRFGGKKIALYPELTQADEDLNKEWMYHGDIATISGRLYLVDEDFIEHVPKEWGAPVRENEDIFYDVEDAKVRSLGVDIIPIAGDDEKITIVKAGFAFADPEDPQSKPFYTAFLGELSKHEYEIPTPEEAEARLMRDWPKQYDIINKLIKTDGLTDLPVRLGMIARKLEKDFKASTELRKLFELFINDRLAFDKEVPYLVTVKDRVISYDGIDPFDPEDKGHWTSIGLKEPLTFFAIAPGVHVSQYDDDVIRMNIMASVFSEENEDDPEYVSVAAGDVTQFRSLRAIRSILSRVYQKADPNMIPASLLQSTLAHTTETSGDDIEHSDISFEGANVDIHEPQYIREMKMLESQLSDVIKKVKQAVKMVYPDEATALEASRSFVEEEMRNQLGQAGIYEGYEFEISGQSALRPRKARDLPDVTDKPHVFVYGVDSDEPYVELQPGDSFKGGLYSIEPFAQAIKDSDEDIIGYVIRPSLVINTMNQTHSSLRWENVSMADINIELRASVPLDGSTEIKIAPLEYYRKVVSAFTKLKNDYPRTDFLRRTQRLHAALNHERPSEFQILRRIDLLQSFADDVRVMKQNGENVYSALNAIEALFLDRIVSLHGNTYVKVGDTFEKANDPDDIFGGVIKDVRQDVMGDNVVFVLQQYDQVRYVPLRTINNLTF